MIRDTSIIDAYGRGDIGHVQAMAALRERRVIEVLSILDRIERGECLPSPAIIHRVKNYIRKIGGVE